MHNIHPEVIHKQNKVLAPVILAITIVLLIAVLRPLYATTTAKNATLVQLENQYEGKKGVKEELLKIEEMFASGAKNDLIDKVNKLNKVYNIPDIMQAIMLNDFTRSTISSPARITL